MQRQKLNPEKKFLTRREVVETYGLGERYLAIAAMRGTGPPFVKASGELGQRGGRVLYAVEKLESWLAGRPAGGEQGAA